MIDSLRMEPRGELRGLTPPALGDRVRFTWRADLGPASRIERLANHLADLASVVELGERWGMILGQYDARRQLLYQARRTGPNFLEREAIGLGFSSDEIYELYEWLDLGFHQGTRRWLTSAYPIDILQNLAAARATRTIGERIDVAQVEYRNPIEIVLGGSGFLLLGVIYAVRFVRDWSSNRRLAAAQATMAEHDARRSGSHADFAEWLVSEARQGRLYAPPQELVNLITNSEVRAIDRLAENDIRLELPPGTDAPPKETSTT
jgi:hypothetical protein